MRAVIQRVTHAKVEVEGQTVGNINNGLLVLLGVGKDDGEKELNILVNKIVNLRIFSDENDKMNLSLLDIKGEMLVVSQFTLYADCRKGRRPFFESAARPELAVQLYERFVEEVNKLGIKV